MTYLVCNAHIDPVWLWRWDEGAGEALSTFRVAADLLDENPDFIFNHNESLLYEWIEEFEPELFARIKKLVKDGRWEVIGGWFLQPDCNIPKGESIVRQILRGHSFFESRFGKVPTVANNFDSFGHARGLATILNKCGYKQYIICRPKLVDNLGYGFDSMDFVWKGYDGSEVAVHRSDEFYNSAFGQVEAKINDWLESHKEEDTLFLWGVGNHGGGASRKDLDDIKKLISKGAKIKHSVPSAYFDKLDTSKLPVLQRSLSLMNEGCYTSTIRVKQQHRRLENELLMTEIMASHAAANNLTKYEAELISDAWRDLLFAEFHDALPGSAIQLVEEDTLRTLNHGLEIVNKLKAKYFFALSAGQEKGSYDKLPILVYNPHPFAVKKLVECSFLLPIQGRDGCYRMPVVFQNGKKLASQPLKEESNLPVDWCKRIAFYADLAPASMNRFDVQFETMPSKPGLPSRAIGGEIKIACDKCSVTINARTGLVDSYIVGGTEYFEKGALSLDIFEDGYDSWRGNFFAGEGDKAPIGAFKPMSPENATKFAGVRGSSIEAVHFVEDGEVRSVVEALLEYGDSRACVRYIVNKILGSLEMSVVVFFGEKEKRIKLTAPVKLPNTEYYGQTMFGSEKLNIASGEFVAHQWTCVCNGANALTIANDGVYGSDFVDGAARLTLLRSAGYSARDPVMFAKHYGDSNDRHLAGLEPYQEKMYNSRMEQGERRYYFIFKGGAREERLKNIGREADVLNMPPYALSYFPPGTGTKPGSLVEIDKENILLSCFKRKEDDENSYIVRIYESIGAGSDYTLAVPSFNIKLNDKIGPYEIKTFLVNREGIRPISMLEK